ncbi:HNH endonuclease [Micromonospora tulbaghiae]|uniref:HNH endonuclease n=1 Tax=Micromonospora tulbaghiae TaxID=479978 RepID=UPI0037208FEC
MLEKRKAIRVCKNCGKSWLASSVEVKYCSNLCQAAFEYGPSRRERKRLTDKQKYARRKLRKAIAGSTGGRVVWAQGACRRCGTYFMTTANGTVPAYCSKRCFRADIRDRRRAREYGAKLTPGRRHAVFERDNWICQICGEPVNRAVAVPQPDAPTIDHVLALARGGAHGEDNWATAHFICNSMKRDIQLKLKVFPRGRFAIGG